MKKLISIFLVLMCLVVFTNCGSDKSFSVTEKNGNVVTKNFQQYGLFDMDENCDARIKYKPVIGNVIWSVICIETIFIPVILVGWYLYEPVAVK
jgi:hypothetical protein